MQCVITHKASTKQPAVTLREALILGVLRAHLTGMGIPPSLADLARCVSVKRQTVHQHIDSLVAKGFLTRERKAYRSIRLTDKKLPYSPR